VQRVTEKAATTAKTISGVATGGKSPAGVAGFVDPLNLWGSLTQQFQQIAANAVKEATTKTAMDTTKHMATGLAKDALKSATAASKKAAAKRSSARKTTNRKSGL
jgi:hypothetical protein